MTRIFQRHLEPGAIYEGAGGQLREILTLGDGPVLVYRMLALGDTCRAALGKLPPQGGTAQITKFCFARWAKREIA